MIIISTDTQPQFSILASVTPVSGLGLPRIERLIKLAEADLKWVHPPPGVTITITGNSVAMTFTGLILILGGLFLLYRD